MALRLPTVRLAPRARALAAHVAYGIAAVVLFPVAIRVLQAGAAEIARPVHAFLGPRSLASLLGLGWLVSTAALSGSPVAAAALTLFDTGVMDERQCFALVVGTRFGAITVALALGALYAIRSGSRASLEVAVLAFLTTQLAGWLSYPLGLLVLSWHAFDVALPDGLFRAAERTAEPVADLLPGWLTFLAGLAALLLAFRLVDLALPRAEAKRVSEARWWRTNPILPFLLGCGVTLVTPSVTISVGALVPLRAKGLVSSERLVPYVLGANVAAFSDTLLAALLLGNPAATNVVCAEIAAIGTAAVLLLAAHEVVEPRLVQLSEEVARTNARAAAFFLAAAAVPALLALG